jgi:predicted kinase
MRAAARVRLGDDGVLVVEPSPVIAVPTRGLVVLIGASGAGKTTFARRHFATTEILSSDAFRAMVGDDERDQSATAPAFDLLYRVLAHRLRRGRLSVVDATNTSAAERRSLLRHAAIARRPAVGIVLDPGDEVCLRRNAARDGRIVDPEVVRRQMAAVRRALADPTRLLGEGFAAVHVLDDPATVDAGRVIRDPSIRGVPPAPEAAAGSRGRGGGAAAARRGEAGGERVGDSATSRRSVRPPGSGRPTRTV